MKWHRVRLQFVLAGASALLIVAACSSLATTSTHSLSGRQTQVSSRLISLHKKGQLKSRQLEAARLLAASTALVTQPDCTKISCIALTFDDGPNPITTPQIVTILEAEHVTATFFMVGSRVHGNEALLQRIHADGNEIGNHSWSHPNLAKLPVDQIKQQIQQTQDVITAAGVPAPTLFRPPYGAINQTVTDSIKPLTTAFWNEDPKDWAAETPQQVLTASEAVAKSGGVIDMHDIYHVTVNSLKQLIDNLKSRHFQFVTMSQLMGEQPRGGEYYGGYHP